MRLFRVLGAALAVAVLASAPALANPKTALDAYVAKPDPAFAWKAVGQISGPGYHGAVLELTSQSWLTDKDVDRPVWKHWLTVIVPDKLVTSTTGASVPRSSIGIETPKLRKLPGGSPRFSAFRVA